ncbi:hypothetical protein H6796_03055 [Candidatus Nomurabacteria bacterium]|nr:hypothetical protein [Candidatus Nomurabacteria bacterium]
MPSLEVITSLVIISVAGLIHASFQMSVSMLTLLSSHTIGSKRSQSRLVLLTNAFVFGAAVAIFMMLATMALIWSLLITVVNVHLLWIICCGLLLGLGVAVWLFYYRRQAGTTLWIPRSLARFLASRAKATKQTAEAFALGLTGVVAEILFIIVPVALASLVLVQLSAFWQAIGIIVYLVTSLLSLLIVNGLIGRGHSIGRIQRWRENNKHFLQFAAGSGLVVLGIYVYVEKVMTIATAVAR